MLVIVKGLQDYKDSWQINGVGMKHFEIMSDRDCH